MKYLIRQGTFIYETLREKVYIFSKEKNYKQAQKWVREWEYMVSNSRYDNPEFELGRRIR